ncbi:hypothetical protein CCACVL1_26425 [Corchorus capsularis]|uniref:Uncharacterized protein n=1 Tax=Corchorus capsularis TaxID=210143 RepID=A0A1R3GEV7_COCAP|nr:hypothetical protein CCACVL1_26425 [Corchorus capsularis]
MAAFDLLGTGLGPKRRRRLLKTSRQ